MPTDWLAPRSTRRVLQERNLFDVENLVLRLYALLPRQLETRSSESEKEAGWKTEVYHQIGDRRSLGQELLGHLHDRQAAAVREFCELYGYEPLDPPLRLCLTSRFTCGLPQPTVLENGMTLLRPWGIPMVPASAVKGTVASWLAAVLAGSLRLKASERDRQLERTGLLPLFGTVSAPGLVEFFDALPERLGGESGLRVDGTTVHYRSWYTEKTPGPPDGCENPVPIPFLTVEEGTCFVFIVAVHKKVRVLSLGNLEGSGNQLLLDGDAVERLREFDIEVGSNTSVIEFVRAALRSTGCYHGFGSQVRKGYGRMVEPVSRVGAHSEGERAPSPPGGVPAPGGATGGSRRRRRRNRR